MTQARPIPFSGPMVTAVLDGKKTVTRRLVTPSRGQQSRWLSIDLLGKSPRAKLASLDDGTLGAQLAHPKAGTWHEGVWEDDWSPLGWVRCPYGKAGDVLYVKENWRCVDWDPDGGRFKVRYEADGTSEWRQAWADMDDPGGDRYDRLWQQGSDDMEAAGFKCVVHAYDELVIGSWQYQGEGEAPTLPWRLRPSLFMPRWASRLALRISEVRVERLQDVTEADAIAEGCQAGSEWGPIDGEAWRDEPKRDWDAREDFAWLWDSINAKRAPWASNPWVWVVSFEVVP